MIENLNVSMVSFEFLIFPDAIYHILTKRLTFNP